MYQEVVWLINDRTFAYLVMYNAHYSIINRTGIVGEEEQIETNEIELWEERIIEYEPDEG